MHLISRSEKYFYPKTLLFANLLLQIPMQNLLMQLNYLPHKTHLVYIPIYTPKKYIGTFNKYNNRYHYYKQKPKN